MISRIYDLTIIGAGAAGLFCASNYDGACCILEKNNEAAKKIYATGNGRCNFLNSEANPSCYNNPDFVEQVFSGACIDDLLYSFENLGIIAKEEDDGRMYPRSEEASAIASALIEGASGSHAEYGFEVKSAVKKNGLFIVEAVDGRIIKSRNLLISTGGKAGIQFGSDGKGFKLAEGFGHTIVKPVPALVPMICAEDLSPIAGVRCEAMINLIRHSMDRDEILAFDYYGEVQFTRNAISGICVMDLSREIRLGEGISYTLSVNPLWDYSEEDRKALLLDFPIEYLVPKKLAEYMKSRSCGLEKALKFTITGTKGWPDAQTTSGGVCVSEINPETMESKLVPGLFFAGEVIDVDGFCGGYNLSFAFSSALVCASYLNIQL